MLLTGRANLVRLVYDCALPNHAFGLAGALVELGGFCDVHAGRHDHRNQVFEDGEEGGHVRGGVGFAEESRSGGKIE